MHLNATNALHGNFQSTLQMHFQCVPLNFMAAFFFSRRDYSSPKLDDLDELNLVRH